MNLYAGVLNVNKVHSSDKASIGGVNDILGEDSNGLKSVCIEMGLR